MGGAECEATEAEREVAMAKKWWIKERHNPQLGVYYVGCGQLTKADAKEMEDSLYGSNHMLAFDTKNEYLERLQELERGRDAKRKR